MEEMKMRGKLKKFVSALVAAGVLMSGMTVPVFAADRQFVCTDFNWMESDLKHYWLSTGQWSDWSKDEKNEIYSVTGGKAVYGKVEDNDAPDRCLKISTKIIQEPPTSYTVGTNVDAWTNGEQNMFKTQNYLHFRFDIALSNYSSKGEDVNAEVKLKFRDKNGNDTNEKHMLGFAYGAIKLAGQWVDFKYDAETWMRCDYVFYKEDSTVDAYINGIKLVSKASLGEDISGDNAAMTYMKFTALDTKTGILPREQDVYIDTIVAKFTDQYPSITQYDMPSSKEPTLEISSKANGIIGANNNIIYGGVNMTANELINTINAPEGSELSVVQENSNDGTWRDHRYVGGDSTIEPVLNKDKHPNKLTETWLRMKLPAISGKRIARIIYFPIVDSRVLSTTAADGVSLDGCYTPGEPMKITVASSANGANVKAMVAQYSKNGELVKCETHDFVSALNTPEIITFTPAADNGDVKIYLWNDGMQAFDTAQVLNPAP